MPDLHDDAYWKQKLTPEQYSIMRCSSTEPPFTGKFYAHREKGTYVCAACGQELFSSDTKYESGSGWPSFWNAVAEDHVAFKPDDSHGMHRTEVVCSKCGSHLGHLFDDSTTPTGKDYCINSAALDFHT